MAKVTITGALVFIINLKQDEQYGAIKLQGVLGTHDQRAS